jgi:peptide/nickel transport system permease protein
VHALYIIKRFGLFLLIVWLAATLNFFLPKLSGQDPVRTKLLEEASLGGYVHAGIDNMVKEYQQRFGLDRPLWRQYLTYLGDVSRGDLNYSIANYPRTVVGMIGEALPWTIGLLGVTTVFSFTLGTILGALLAWPGAPAWMRLVEYGIARSSAAQSRFLIRTCCARSGDMAIGSPAMRS